MCKLSGDDRFGSPSGETLYINVDHRDEIKRMLIFVYIYDGTPAFDRTHAVVTLYPSTGPRVEIKLDERAPQARSCAVFMLENNKGELTVRREVKYVYGFQAELDRLYGWGLQWGRGYKIEGVTARVLRVRAVSADRCCRVPPVPGVPTRHRAGAERLPSGRTGAGDMPSGAGTAGPGAAGRRTGPARRALLHRIAVRRAGGCCCWGGCGYAVRGLLLGLVGRLLRRRTG